MRKTGGKYRAHLLWSVVAPVAVVLLGLVYEAYLTQRAEQQLRLQALSELSTLRAQLEGVVNRNISLVQGLIAVIATRPDITQREFEQLGAEVFRQPAQLRNIGLARDMVISHMYPLQGNEQALGLNYLTHPQQREAALRVRDSGRMVVAGPLKLVQGGMGLVARAPVFVRDADTGATGRFWGLVSAVIDANALYRAAGLTQLPRGLRVAVRGTDGKGAYGAAFFGPAALFGESPVVLDVTLPSGTWQIGATPVGGWRTPHPDIWLVHTAIALLAGLAMVLVAIWRRYQRERALNAQRLMQAQAMLLAALEQSPAGIILAEAPSGRVRLVNTAALKTRHLREDDVYGHAFTDMVKSAPPQHPDGRLFDLDELPLARAIYHGESPRNLEMVLNKDTPAERWLLANAGPVRNTEGEIIAGVVVVTDVTEVKRAEEQIRQRAYYDALTSLPNRTLFMEVLEKAVVRNARQGTLLALMYIDLDRFKHVNDTLGHDVGDRMLREAADRIRELVRESDTVARLGGDEFTVILTDLTHTDSATVIAEKLILRLAAPYNLMGRDIYSGASVGITFSPADGLSPATLLKNADMAMYQAKERGRNTFQFFTQEMTNRAETFVAVEKDLRLALERGELRLVYQPIFHIPTGKQAGLEALVRWEHPQWGLVGPERFIPVAEETGLIQPLGTWVLRTACREALALADASGTPPRLSVNVSSRQFRLGFDAGLVSGVLQETGYPADRLVLEITESLLLEEEERVMCTLTGLRGMGVGLSVDDFGTGYSSLGYLRRFPVSVLKIDREFVRDLASDPRDANLVEAIVAIARSLQLHVVAEGVETEEQLAQLAKIGCDYAQGFLLGRPVPLALLREPRAQPV